MDGTLVKSVLTMTGLLEEKIFKSLGELELMKMEHYHETGFE
jgi:hypothetical protein